MFWDGITDTLLCRLIGHDYAHEYGCFSHYSICRRCSYIENDLEKQIFDYEEQLWQQMKRDTGRTIRSMRYDQQYRMEVDEKVIAYRRRVFGL